MRRPDKTANEMTGMAFVDPRLTERCLQSQPDVVAAHAWFEENRLVAAVTVLEGTSLTRRQLQRVCRTELGPDQTPVSMDLVQTKRKAA
jgi:hypothetical protein